MVKKSKLFFRSWRTLQFVFVLPNFLLLAYKFILPESPRWLATKGKVYGDNQKTLEYKLSLKLKL